LWGFVENGDFDLKSTDRVEETFSPEETREYAVKLASQISEDSIVLLFGGLGCGKTIFAKGLAEGFGVSEYVTSPTFTILHEYDGTVPVRHFDLYRIKDFDEFLENGFLEIAEENGITMIEWAERVPELMNYPKTVIVKIDKDNNKDDNYRKIFVSTIWKE
jgi:tRNA threonylcarbamoyladenosine biosynthesis protein TsaE